MSKTKTIYSIEPPPDKTHRQWLLAEQERRNKEYFASDRAKEKPNDALCRPPRFMGDINIDGLWRNDK